MPKPLLTAEAAPSIFRVAARVSQLENFHVCVHTHLAYTCTLLPLASCYRHNHGGLYAGDEVYRLLHGGFPDHDLCDPAAWQCISWLLRLA